MGPLTALLLATPIFGFALAPPQLDGLPHAAMPAAQVESSLSLDAEVDSDGSSASSSDESSASSAGPVDQATYVKQLRKRAKLAKIHRTLGIATWAATALAVVSGTIQYRNQYGGGELAGTPCVTGDATFSQEQCYGAPLVHAIPGFVAGGLYFTTMGLQLAMPDPDHASVGDSKFAKKLRTHKILRWVHLTGMVTQMVLGIVMANPKIGLDRANDYDTMQTLARVHLASGYITFGALTWAGTIMLL
jgi:hypothetical protein